MLRDFETWSILREHYLPTEYHTLYKVINKHCDKFHEMPSFEDLKYEIRDNSTQEKLFAIEAVEVDVDAVMLLEYLKNEFTQKEILLALEKYIDLSVAFEDAEESVTHLHQIILDIEAKVELEAPQETMQRITLFEAEEELGKYLALGLNSEFDLGTQFSPRDYVLLGGKRGHGKSVVSANIATNVYDSGRSAIYFTIEMDGRETLQRLCSISTGVSADRLRYRNLNITEWEKVATWWAARFDGGEEYLAQYKNNRDFDRFHQLLTSKCALDPIRQLDVIYDPQLTLTKIRAELDKKVKGNMDIGVIIVDYINQVKRSHAPHRNGQYDWTEQIEVSKALKIMAQTYGITIVSPYQIDTTGEARFSKGILDAADAAYIINRYSQEDECMELKCVKKRKGGEISFVSAMDWNSLKLGPESALTPDDKKSDESSSKTGEEINDL